MKYLINFILTPKCKSELNQLLTIRKEKLPIIISETRKEIFQAWEKLQISIEEREKFLPFYESKTITKLT